MVFQFSTSRIPFSTPHFYASVSLLKASARVHDWFVTCQYHFLRSYCMASGALGIRAWQEGLVGVYGVLMDEGGTFSAPFSLFFFSSDTMDAWR